MILVGLRCAGPIYGMWFVNRGRLDFFGFSMAFGEEVPSSEPAVGRSPERSAAKWRRTVRAETMSTSGCLCWWGPSERRNRRRAV